MRAILFDADDDLAQHYGALLTEAGFEVARPKTLGEACALVPQSDAVFIEPIAPGGDGILLLGELGRLPKRPTTVALTAFPMLVDKLPSVDATMEKPVSAGEIEAAAAAIRAGHTPISCLRPREAERARQRMQEIIGLRLLDGHLDDRLGEAAEKAARLFDTSMAFVTLILPDKQHIQIAHGMEVSDEARDRPLRDSFCYNAVEAERTLEIADVSKIPALRGTYFESQKALGSYLGAPIVGPGGVAIGALCVADRGPRKFSPQDADLLEILARRLSEELARRAESERERQRAYLDPSGAWTRVGWRERVALEQARSDRPAAVLMVGFDRRDAFVEHAGREAWERVLAGAYERFASLLPRSAVIGRTADDELAVWLPDLPEDRARPLADGLVASIQRWNMPVPASDGVVTCAIGVATRGGRPSSVVERAEQALRQARRRARTHSVESGDAEQPSTGMPEPGWIIDRKYVIEKQLSAGGMGIVYVAQDLHLDRKVALKVIRPELTGSPGFTELFRMEAMGMAAVRHPNLAEVYAFGEDAGRLFLVMELIRGESVGNDIQRLGTLPPPRVGSIVRQVAAALDALHAAGIVHRDVKPANVLFESEPAGLPPSFGAPRDGRAVLVDFGVVTRTQRPSQMLGGTQGYMAPEALISEHVTAQADVYSLAATAHQMLTGALPGWDKEALPGPLGAVFARGLDVIAERRYESAGAFAEALSAALERGTVGLLERFMRWAGRGTIDPGPADVPTTPSLVHGSLLVAIEAFGARSKDGARIDPGQDYPAGTLERLLADVLGAASGEGRKRLCRLIGHRAVEWAVKHDRLPSSARRSTQAALDGLPAAWRALVGIGHLAPLRLDERRAQIAFEGALPSPDFAELAAGAVEALAAEAAMVSPKASLANAGDALELELRWAR